jgi:hypothetical protein
MTTSTIRPPAIGVVSYQSPPTAPLSRRDTARGDLRVGNRQYHPSPAWTSERSARWLITGQDSAQSTFARERAVLRIRTVMNHGQCATDPRSSRRDLTTEPLSPF